MMDFFTLRVEVQGRFVLDRYGEGSTGGTCEYPSDTSEARKVWKPMATSHKAFRPQKQPAKPQTLNTMNACSW